MSQIRVLHVDDDSDIREVVDLSLSLDSEFEVRACASGSEALVVAAQWSPSIILLDVVMPVMDGKMALAHLRQNPRTAHIPVLFMTACMPRGGIDRLISLGACGILFKPFDPMTLAAVVRSHLRVRTHIESAVGWMQ